jgi:hypothetical protein
MQKLWILKTGNLAMETRLKDFRSENNNEWLNFKRDFSRDMDDLGLALTNLGKDNVSQR